VDLLEIFFLTPDFWILFLVNFSVETNLETIAYVKLKVSPNTFITTLSIYLEEAIVNTSTTDNANNSIPAVSSTSETSQTLGFAKIFVAVDSQDATDEVFAKALQLAARFGSQLMVFHCVKGTMLSFREIYTTASIGAYGGIYTKEMLEMEEELKREALAELQSWLHSFGKKGEESGISIESDYKIGEPGSQICAAAKSWGADLILIGRRGRTGLSEIILGSVSNYVVHHAHCSVLVIQ
jgi:nucleotide-binding universal stress UspA family protein